MNITVETVIADMKREQTQDHLLLQCGVKGPISFYDFLVLNAKRNGESDEYIERKINEVAQARINEQYGSHFEHE